MALKLSPGHDAPAADEWLRLFGLSFHQEGHDALMEASFIKDGPRRRFTPQASEWGVVPFLLDHPLHSHIDLHRHDFFEVALVLNGSARYRIENRERMVTAGDLLFIGHRLPHSYQIGGLAFRLINICFDPKILFPASSGASLDYFEHFRLMRPFFSGQENHFCLHVAPGPFARLTATAADLVLRFQEKNGGARLETLKQGLSYLLHAMANCHERAHPMSPNESNFLGRALALISADPGQGDLSLGNLAKQLGMNPFTFSRQFKREVGKTLPEYLNRLRIENAKNLLRGSTLSVTDIALDAGFPSLAHFHRTFKEYVGATPGAFRQGRVTKGPSKNAGAVSKKVKK